MRTYSAPPWLGTKPSLLGGVRDTQECGRVWTLPYHVSFMTDLAILLQLMFALGSYKIKRFLLVIFSKYFGKRDPRIYGAVTDQVRRWLFTEHRPLSLKFILTSLLTGRQLVLTDTVMSDLMTFKAVMEPIRSSRNGQIKMS